jgi:hypothetical protein
VFQGLGLVFGSINYSEHWPRSLCCRLCVFTQFEHWDHAFDSHWKHGDITCVAFMSREVHVRLYVALPIKDS